MHIHRYLGIYLKTSATIHQNLDEKNNASGNVEDFGYFIYLSVNTDACELLKI
jgi:hypothetical protein